MAKKERMVDGKGYKNKRTKSVIPFPFSRFWILNPLINKGKKKKINKRRVKGSNFDRLPDDILVSILDRLEWEDAAATSCLSRSLYRVWENFLQKRTRTHRLHRGWEGFLDHKKKLILHHDGRNNASKFMDFVNHVLRIHRESEVDSLRIHVGYEAKLEDGFKNWVAFARAKCVRSLDIYLSIIRDWISELPLFPTFDGFDKLTSLSLSSVRINDADLEHGLKSHLINLESLSISYAPNLKRVVVASQKLNNLRIECCNDICSIDIVSAPNLQWFTYKGHKFVTLHFNNVPKLSNVSLDEVGLCMNSLSELHKVGTLEKLQLYPTPRCQNPKHVECMRNPPHFPLLENLKELQLTFEMLKDNRVPWLFITIILAACPKLHKLTLKNYYLWQLPGTGHDLDAWFNFNTDELRLRSQTHPCLKMVQFIGWGGPWSVN